LRAGGVGTALCGALLAATVMVGCSASSIATESSEGEDGKTCADVREAGGFRAISCVEAVAAAEASLPAHGPFRAVTFQRAGSLLVPACAGAPVPCAFPQSGVVAFEFWWGEPIRIGVQLADGTIEVSPPIEGTP
jgi:hypothetical protein